MTDTPDIRLTGPQAWALAEAIQKNASDDEVLVTQQGDRSLVVGFGLATVEINIEGDAFDD